MRPYSNKSSIMRPYCNKSSAPVATVAPVIGTEATIKGDLFFGGDPLEIDVFADLASGVYGSGIVYKWYVGEDIVQIGTNPFVLTQDRLGKKIKLETVAVNPAGSDTKTIDDLYGYDALIAGLVLEGGGNLILEDGGRLLVL